MDCRAVDLARFSGTTERTSQFEEQFQLPKLALVVPMSTFLTADAHGIPWLPYHLNAVLLHLRALLEILLGIKT
jgi:hypothetical protein